MGYSSASFDPAQPAANSDAASSATAKASDASSVAAAASSAAAAALSKIAAQSAAWEAATTVAGDHGSAATDQIVNVCYGTGDPPSAATTTEGTLFIKYTA